MIYRRSVETVETVPKRHGRLDERDINIRLHPIRFRQNLNLNSANKTILVITIIVSECAPNGKHKLKTRNLIPNHIGHINLNKLDYS